MEHLKTFLDAKEHKSVTFRIRVRHFKFYKQNISY
jgi:hypothetical protein